MTRLVTLHGWGNPAPGYAQKFHERLQKLVGPLRLVELHYGHLVRWYVLGGLAYRLLPGVGQHVRAILAHALQAGLTAGEPLILVTHSYGCLVSFDLGFLPVDLYVTMDLRLNWLRPCAPAPVVKGSWVNLWDSDSWFGGKLARRWPEASDVAVDVAGRGNWLGIRDHACWWESAKAAAEVAHAWRVLRPRP